jgi:hypothetical protein
MLSTLWPILLEFRSVFIHQSSFLWFCTVVVGLAAGSDDIGGVTSIARNLQMTERGYWGLTRFFDNHDKKLRSIQMAWVSLAMRLFDTSVTIAGRVLVIADGTKASKRGRKMPGVIGLKDTSNDCWIRGHQFEQLCLVVRGLANFFPVPLATSLLTGFDDGKSLSERCTDFILRYPQLQGCLIVGDAWYSKSKIIIELARKGAIAMVTRLAKNVVAHEPYLENPFAPKRRGRKCKYGKKLKLYDLFDGTMETWTIFDNSGNPMEVRGWCRDLLWKPLKMLVRFVGIEHPEKGRMILLSSDVTFGPTDIAQSYVYRFWIEIGFHTAKSLLGSFSYRFWIKVMDRLGSFPKEINLAKIPAALANRMLEKVRVIELFITCAGIAQGLLVYLSIYHTGTVAHQARFWLRTKRGGIAGERIAAAYVKLSLRNLSKAKPDSTPLEKFIAEKQGWVIPTDDSSEKSVA